jgi:hypothetical protein
LSLPPMQGREDGSCSAMERRWRHKRKLKSLLSSSSSSSTPPIHSLAQSRELLPLLVSSFFFLLPFPLLSLSHSRLHLRHPIPVFNPFCTVIVGVGEIRRQPSNYIW